MNLGELEGAVNSSWPPPVKRWGCCASVFECKGSQKQDHILGGSPDVGTTLSRPKEWVFALIAVNGFLSAVSLPVNAWWTGDELKHLGPFKLIAWQSQQVCLFVGGELTPGGGDKNKLPVRVRVLKIRDPFRVLNDTVHSSRTGGHGGTTKHFPQNQGVNPLLRKQAALSLIINFLIGILDDQCSFEGIRTLFCFAFVSRLVPGYLWYPPTNKHLSAQIFFG